MKSLPNDNVDSIQGMVYNLISNEVTHTANSSTFQFPFPFLNYLAFLFKSNAADEKTIEWPCKQIAKKVCFFAKNSHAIVSIVSSCGTIEKQIFALFVNSATVF